ncbi:MAG TPA: ATP-binding cassette domain-containing protein [Methanomassiliicoccales archaeon]|nr:ATP-binding cassette domain-containing protein [Methanomassiliicoccales archaeon]
MTDVIVARSLTKRYDELMAVDAIDFTIHERECFGFLGPNGAGKTTIIRMIQCVSPLTSGSLSVLGMDVDKDERKIKEVVGVVPQDNNLDPDFNVLKNLTVYASYFGIDKETAQKKAEELLRFMQLTEKKDAKIDEISGGMKRRLTIARALINDPKVLILDEPTTGLDPQARHVIWDKIRELKERGVTVIVTTHYMEEAQRLCDRLVIMETGKILVEGEPNSLIAKIIGSGVVEVIEPTLEVEEFGKQSGWNQERADDRLFIYTNENQEVRRKLQQRFPTINSLIRDATLEDVFLKLTGRGLKE